MSEDMLARHINALNKLARGMVHSIQQHDKNLASYMHTMDNRISNIGMKENEMAIQHIQTQLHESFNNLEQCYAAMNVLVAKQNQRSRLLEHRFSELLRGVYDLVEGKLSPNLIPVSVMINTMSDIQRILHEKFKMHKFVFENPDEIYKHANFIFSRHGLKLFVSVKFPISPFSQPLSLFKSLSFPVPVNDTSNHATQLLNLPKVFANNMQYYTHFTMSELNQCKTGKIMLCKSRKALVPIIQDSCSSALFKGDRPQIKEMCNFRFLPNGLNAGIVQLTQTSVLVYNTPTLEFDCRMSKTMKKGCTFCVINVPCECAVSTTVILLS